MSRKLVRLDGINYIKGEYLLGEGCYVDPKTVSLIHGVLPGITAIIADGRAALVMANPDEAHGILFPKGQETGGMDAA